MATKGLKAIFRRSKIVPHGSAKQIEAGTALRNMDDITLKEFDGFGDVKKLPDGKEIGKVNENMSKVYDRVKQIAPFLLKAGIVGGAFGLYYNSLKTEEERTEFACKTFCMPKQNGSVWNPDDEYRKAELEAHGLEQGPICDPVEIADCEEYCDRTCDQGLNFGGPIEQFLRNFIPDDIVDMFSNLGTFVQYALMAACCMCIAFVMFKMMGMASDTTNAAKPNS